jgi:2C-methyl-D-erythritol 2,4-cyclodiphosphate synthase
MPMSSHAICDALLGAVAEGILKTFPDTDPGYRHQEYHPLKRVMTG